MGCKQRSSCDVNIKEQTFELLQHFLVLQEKVPSLSSLRISSPLLVKSIHRKKTLLLFHYFQCLDRREEGNDDVLSDDEC